MQDVTCVLWLLCCGFGYVDVTAGGSGVWQPTASREEGCPRGGDSKIGSTFTYNVGSYRQVQNQFQIQNTQQNKIKQT